MSQSVIDDVVLGKLQHYRYCYQRVLAEEPDLTGSLSVRFTIAPDGSVVIAEVAKTDLPESVTSCILGRIRTLAFPAPNGGGRVDVTFPFVFEP